MASRIQPPQVPVQAPAPKREFTTPDISWDSHSLGPGISVNSNSKRLFNHLVKKPYPPPSHPYSFPGARATVPLSAGDLVYWEVAWRITRPGKFKPGVKRLIQMGVATEDVLRAAMEDSPLENVNRAGITVVADVDQEEDEIDIRATHGPLELDPEALAAQLYPTGANGARMGFLFDGPKSTIYVFKVTESEIWWTSEVDVSQPLYPFVCVQSREKVGKEIWIELLTGFCIAMTETKRALLDDVLKGNAGRHKVIPFMS